MTKTEWLDAIYSRLNGNIDGERAVKLAIAIDDEQYQMHAATAAQRALVADLKAMERRRLQQIDVTALRSGSGEAALFDASGFDVETSRLLRERIRWEGRSVPVMNLAGADGGRLLIDVAERDETGARTTLTRSSFMKALGGHVIAESERLGRDVSVAEVIELRRAA